ncbi:ferritin-like domain-containing protein [Streptomyces sp. MS1.AVA.1]|uniref:Ferritin-like domain-containing protein n=1 Tax=Streptomyces machairae TaxID=3134109 RepID=A0ABU8URW2_9ACTN
MARPERAGLPHRRRVLRGAAERVPDGAAGTVGAGQLSQYVFSDDLSPIENLDHVEQAIRIIMEQGEGTTSSPSASFEDDHPAHYYAFGEIYHGRELRRTDDGWQYVGAPVPFPDVRPMAPIPVGGWPNPPAGSANSCTSSTPPTAPCWTASTRPGQAAATAPWARPSTPCTAWSGPPWN